MSTSQNTAPRITVNIVLAPERGGGRPLDVVLNVNAMDPPTHLHSRIEELLNQLARSDAAGLTIGSETDTANKANFDWMRAFESSTGGLVPGEDMAETSPFSNIASESPFIGPESSVTPKGIRFWRPQGWITPSTEETEPDTDVGEIDDWKSSGLTPRRSSDFVPETSPAYEGPKGGLRALDFNHIAEEAIRALEK